MARDYTNESRTAVRRNDREVTEDAWIRQFLHQSMVGTLATVHDGQPFVNTNLFVYDEANHCIYTHTARVGRTRANVEKGNPVCFSIMAMGRLLPADVALEFSVEYAGVTIFGDASVIEDETEAIHALQMIMDKYAPHLVPNEHYREPVPEELKRTSVFKISIEDWTGKKKEVDAHDGAYWLDETPILESVQSRSLWRGTVNEILITPQAEQLIQSVNEVNAVAGCGLEGDRYFEVDDSDGEGRNITLIAQEEMDAVALEGLTVDGKTMRRNIVTQGVPLNHLIGKRFRIGEAICEGVLLCEPCNDLVRMTGIGKRLLSHFVHRAGLRANIIKSGVIRAGDIIVPLD